jgi:hypothetical protein
VKKCVVQKKIVGQSWAVRVGLIDIYGSTKRLTEVHSFTKILFSVTTEV